MYCVHWLETVVVSTTPLTDVDNLVVTALQPHHKLFLSAELTQALKFCEELRKRRREGERLSFIGMVSEDPNCVGEQGVSDVLPPGYDWKKRRI